MNLNEILKQYDPAQEAGDADVAGLRETIMTSPRRPPRRARRAVLACALLVVIILAAISRRVAQTLLSVDRPTAQTRVSVPQRQLQLTTPGGTQLIWVFNDSM
jgi:ferric-dicitrate binding protein FerR (iron transport regulator)